MLVPARCSGFHSVDLFCVQFHVSKSNPRVPGVVVCPSVFMVLTGVSVDYSN